MNLIPNWREVIKKAWSVKLIALATVLSGVEAVLPLFESRFPQGMFAAVSGLVTAMALLARILAQNELSTQQGEMK